MSNLESKPESNQLETGFQQTGELGREISPEHSIPVQKRLMYAMLPVELLSRITPADGVSLGSNEDDIFLAWHNLFSASFRQFWDTRQNEDLELKKQEIYQKVLLETETDRVLTEEDYQVLIDSFTNEAKSKFLSDVSEILEAQLH